MMKTINCEATKMSPIAGKVQLMVAVAPPSVAGQYNLSHAFVLGHLIGAGAETVVGVTKRSQTKQAFNATIFTHVSLNDETLHVVYIYSNIRLEDVVLAFVFLSGDDGFGFPPSWRRGNYIPRISTPL